jgi:hypothetical protein
MSDKAEDTGSTYDANQFNLQGMVRKSSVPHIIIHSRFFANEKTKKCIFSVRVLRSGQLPTQSEL